MSNEWTDTLEFAEQEALRNLLESWKFEFEMSAGERFAIRIVDLKDNDIENSDIADKLSALGDELGVVITIQHTDLFNRMHRI